MSLLTPQNSIEKTTQHAEAAPKIVSELMFS
jgi:hypothetical protein